MVLFFSKTRKGYLILTDWTENAVGFETVAEFVNFVVALNTGVFVGVTVVRG